MTFCPVCDTDPCEQVELLDELAHVPYNLVDEDQLVAHYERVESVLERVRRTHELVSGGQA